MKLSKILESLNIKQDLKYDFHVTNIAPVDKALKNEISFINSKNFLKLLDSSNAGAVFVKSSSEIKRTDLNLIEVPNPRLTMAHISKIFFIEEFNDFLKRRIKNSKIAKSAIIMPNVYIGSNVLIGKRSKIMPGSVISDNVIIGDDTCIYPNVVIYHKCVIGNNVRIHAGSVIGVDSFGYETDKDGQHHKIYHNGIVIIGNNVEIGANCTIGRAVLEKTEIQNGSKLGSLVEVSHNCIVGKNNLLVSQVGLAGSTTTGRNVVFGGQAGTGGHLHIGDFTQVAGRAAISKSIPANSKYGGHPMMELNEWMKFYVSLRRLLKKQNHI